MSDQEPQFRPIRHETAVAIDFLVERSCNQVANEIAECGSTAEYFVTARDNVKGGLHSAIIRASANYQLFLNQPRAETADTPKSIFSRPDDKSVGNKNVPRLEPIEALHGLTIGALVAKKSITPIAFMIYSERMAHDINVHNALQKRFGPTDLANYLKNNAGETQAGIQQSAPKILEIITHSGKYPQLDSVYSRAASYMIGATVTMLTEAAIQGVNGLTPVQKAMAKQEITDLHNIMGNLYVHDVNPDLGDDPK